MREICPLLIPRRQAGLVMSNPAYARLYKTQRHCRARGLRQAVPPS